MIKLKKSDIPALLLAAADSRGILPEHLTDKSSLGEDLLFLPALKAVGLKARHVTPENIAEAKILRYQRKEAILQSWLDSNEKEGTLKIYVEGDPRFDPWRPGQEVKPVVEEAVEVITPPQPSKSNGHLKARGKLFDYPITAVLRKLGAIGWSWEEARDALATLGIECAESTVRIQIRAGVVGDASRGEPADLTPKQIAYLEIAK